MEGRELPARPYVLCSMRRRSFLGLALLTPFARRALADATVPPAGAPSGPKPTGDKPLLVLVVPQKWPLLLPEGTTAEPGACSTHPLLLLLLQPQQRLVHPCQSYLRS